MQELNNIPDKITSNLFNQFFKVSNIKSPPILEQWRQCRLKYSSTQVGLGSIFGLIFYITIFAVFVVPSIVKARQIHDLKLHVNDADIEESQHVLASIQFCIRQPLAFSLDEHHAPKAMVVPVHIVVDDWPRARGCTSNPSKPYSREVQPICTRQIKIKFLRPSSSRDMCTEVLPICRFSPNPHRSPANDPLFFACVQNADGSTLYSGSVQIRHNNRPARQAATSARLGIDLGVMSTNILIHGERPQSALKSGGFVWETDPRITKVSEIQTIDGIKMESESQGTWKFSIDSPSDFHIEPERPLVRAIIQATNLGDFEPNELSYSGISLSLRDIAFYDKAGFSVPYGEEPGSFLSIGIDQDNDGIVDFRDDDKDGDGFVDAVDAFPFLSTEQQDLDNDKIGDSFEIQYFGDLNQDPDQDWDLDGLSNLHEFLLHTNPTQDDSDLDQTPDGADDFPLDPQFVLDSDRDRVPDLLDAFPWDPFSGRDRDHDGLPDAFELHWFNSIQTVEPGSDPDRDGAIVFEEWKLGSSPLSNPPMNSFPGGGNSGESLELDSLIVATSILNGPPEQAASEIIGVIGEFAEIEFFVSDSADLSSVELIWNGSNLLGKDNIVNSGDEPVNSTILDWSRAQRRIRISNLAIATGFKQTLEVRVSSQQNPHLVDHDRYVFYHGEPAVTATSVCQFHIARTNWSLTALVMLISICSRPKRKLNPL